MNITALKKFFVFENLSEDELIRLTDSLSLEERSYEKNETILSDDVQQKKIGFVISGECAVYKSREKKDILLQTLRANDSFGILTLFTEDEYPTIIVAKKPSTVVFISKNDFINLIHASSKIALNVISFLSNKVSFLNKKIATLSGATVEEKVDNYLQIQYKSCGDEFYFNAAVVAGQINIGRASLYRILRKLEENQIIELKNKTIKITNKLYFERKSK